MGAQSSAWRVVFVASLAASALIILQTAFDISWLAWARAPLLMPFVFAWTLLTRPRPERRVFAPLLLAQVFSFLGDVLLAADGLFVPGVAMFLVAQVCYIVTFTGWRGPHQVKLKPWTLVPYVAYLAAMLIVVVRAGGRAGAADRGLWHDALRDGRRGDGRHGQGSPRGPRRRCLSAPSCSSSPTV